MQKTLIKLNQVDIVFGKQTVVKDVSFSIDAGEYVALIGANGSGKTSLMRVILNLVEPAHGNVYVDASLKIGYLSQRLNSSDRFFPATVNEIVSMGILVNRPFPKRLKKTDQVAIDKVLTLLEICGEKHKKIGVLSGGQQQRVLLARALVSEPDILLLDEPTSALDPSMRQSFYDLLTELNKKGITIVLITHDVSTIAQYASKVILVDQTILFNGTVNDFIAREDLSPFIHASHHEGSEHHV